MDSNEEKKSKLRNTQLATILVLPTCNIEKVTVSNPKGLEGKQTLENSIFLTLRLSDSERDNMFLCCFLEQSINIFNVNKWAFEANITNSSSPAMLVKTELKKLNKFFETGKHQAGKAHHSRLVTEDVYDVHTTRLYGRKLKLIRREKWNDLAVVMNDGDRFSLESMDNFFKGGEPPSSKDIMGKMEYFKANIDYVVTLEWYLSIDLQVLLWLRGYLENLNESQDFKEIFSRRERVSPIEFLPRESRKQGFQIDDPLHTVPVLYQVLIGENLIMKISFTDFNGAFINEKGCIDWHGNKDQLGYLIKTLKSKGIITSKNHMETATRVFKATSGKALDAGGLSTSADNLSEKNRLSMDTLISQVIDS